MIRRQRDACNGHRQTFRRQSDACNGRRQVIKRQSSQADTEVALDPLEFTCKSCKLDNGELTQKAEGQAACQMHGKIQHLQGRRRQQRSVKGAAYVWMAQRGQSEV